MLCGDLNKVNCERVVNVLYWIAFLWYLRVCRRMLWFGEGQSGVDEV